MSAPSALPYSPDLPSPPPWSQPRGELRPEDSTTHPPPPPRQRRLLYPGMGAPFRESGSQGPGLSKPAWGPPGQNWRRLGLESAPTSLKGPKKEPLKRKKWLRSGPGVADFGLIPPHRSQTHTPSPEATYLFSATIDRSQGLVPVGLIQAVFGRAQERNHAPAHPTPPTCRTPH